LDELVRLEEQKVPLVQTVLKVIFPHLSARRQLFGLVTDDAWLKATMDELLLTDQPPKWEKIQASNGWVTAFNKRSRISSQYQTNKKNTPLFKKIPLVQKFHQWLLLDLQQRDKRRT
jgi:hypothetical protein